MSLKSINLNSLLSWAIIFIIWRSILFIIAYIASIFIPFQYRFAYVETFLQSTGLPSWIWGFGNFDGVHYLRIAVLGYRGSAFSQAFFPLYPTLIKILSFNNYAFLAGLVISNIFFLLSLYFLYKLFLLDYSKEISFKSVVFLLCFPTSFYFGAVYTESLFILLVILSVFFLRRQKYLLSGFFAAAASGTRVVGIFLCLLILFELIKNKEKMRGLIALLVAPLGLIYYMIYLKVNFDNPLLFASAPTFFGMNRQTSVILLPQVFYRYFKILKSVPILSGSFFNASLELVFTVLSLLTLIIAVRKVRASYIWFSFACLILPTLTGTLASMPRYVLIMFLIFPALVIKAGRYFYRYAVVLFVFGLILTGLFVRGFWIA